MKTALKKGWKYLLGGVLALLGFGGCNKEEIIDNGGSMLSMYGQPTAVFKMLGTVKNQSGKPVKGIRVVIDNFITISLEHLTERQTTDTAKTVDSNSIHVELG